MASTRNLGRNVDITMFDCCWRARIWQPFPHLQRYHCFQGFQKMWPGHIGILTGFSEWEVIILVIERNRISSCINQATRTIFRGSSCQTANWFLCNCHKTWRFRHRRSLHHPGFEFGFCPGRVRDPWESWNNVTIQSIPMIQREITWFWNPGTVRCQYFQIRTCVVLKIELQTT